MLLKAWNYSQLLPPTDPIFNQILPQSTPGNGFCGLGRTGPETPPQTGLGPRSALDAGVRGSNWKGFETWQLHNEELNSKECGSRPNTQTSTDQRRQECVAGSPGWPGGRAEVGVSGESAQGARRP